uniref:Uncharacterized protein n=1 Tax=Anguilla anguilla TaxID=7936 RepID=A0A0E9U5V9_ANGAN
MCQMVTAVSVRALTGLMSRCCVLTKES